ncbi:arylamine N-acetyltransferase family protein [Chitinilyticum aquatile]|uniref:arylamine N-acetyltransferase family protein n=1 Tax=Chitinilyticum aquatile TaxID=362520 RepID=UPI00040A1393|nr:arylamine N-acetyltransferase [Chitinilyticum aquatile]
MNIVNEAPAGWLDDYLQRLALPAWPPLTVAGLSGLHRRHVERLPFGNVDVMLDAVPQLEHAALVEKLLRAGRPGYCYELNALFAALLEAQGLVPQRHMARVLLEGVQVHERPRSHLVLTAEMDGERWLLDVGFGGGGLVEPLPLRADVVFEQGIDRYRLLALDEPAGWLLQRDLGGQWDTLYWFDLLPAYPADCFVGNHFAATFPGSRFRTGLIVTRIEGDTRLVLHNLQRIHRRGAQAQRWPIADAQALQQVLESDYALALDEDEAERLFAVQLANQS